MKFLLGKSEICQNCLFTSEQSTSIIDLSQMKEKVQIYIQVGKLNQIFQTRPMFKVWVLNFYSIQLSPVMPNGLTMELFLNRRLRLISAQ